MNVQKAPRVAPAPATGVRGAPDLRLLAGAALALWLLGASLEPARARAETVLLLPPRGDQRLPGAQRKAEHAAEAALRERGAELLSHADAAARAGSSELAGCRQLDCAPALLRAVQAEVAVAVSVRASVGGPPDAVAVTLVDRDGHRYPGQAQVQGEDLAAASRAALGDARALQVLGPGPWLRVLVTPAGGKVLLAGKLVGAAPYRAHVESGRYVLEVRHAGYASYVRTVDIPPEPARQVEIEVRLEPRAEPAAAASAQAGSEPRADRPHAGRGALSIVGPVALGVLGAGLLATDVVLVARSGCRRQDAAGVCIERAQIDTARTVLWGVAGVAAITGAVVWYVLADGDSPEHADPVLAVSVGPRQVLLAGSF